jgi:MFS family permease
VPGTQHEQQPVLVRPEEHPPKARAGKVIIPLLAAGLTYATAQTTIVPALPEIQRATHSSPSAGAWVVTGFFVSSAALTVIAGRLGDLFGKRRVLLAILALFGVGAGLCTVLGDSITAVIAGRVIMGAAGGVFPLAYALIGDLLPRDRAAFGMGLISSMYGLGGAIGLPLGGLIADRFGHRGLFALTVVMTVVALAMVAALVPRSSSDAAAATTADPARIDWLGAILLAVGLGTPLVGISRGSAWGWTSVPTLACWVVGVVSLVVLFLVESRVRSPLIHLPTMGLRNVWVANAVAFLVTFGQSMSFLLVPQLAQLPKGTGLGADVLESGLYLLPASVTVLFTGPLTGALVPRLGVRFPLIVGPLTTVAGLAVLALGGPSPMLLLAGSALVGIGGGAAFAVFPMLIEDAVTPDRRGAANGVNTIMRHISMALSAQIAAAILVAATPTGTAYPTGGAFTTDFLVGAVIGALALVVVPAVTRRTAPAPA